MRYALATFASAPDFTWDEGPRLFRGGGGTVTRETVRASVESMIATTQAMIGKVCDDLASGAINEVEWALRMRNAIKLVHIAAGTVALGGREQLDANAFGAIGRRLKEQYKYLDDFSYEIANGYDLGARFRSRAQSYADAAYGTLAGMERAADIATGRVLTEQRFLNPHADHCDECVEEADKGPQPPGVLKAIGKCQCLVKCRCSFKRKLSRLDQAASTAPPPTARKGIFGRLKDRARAAVDAFNRLTGW